MGMSTNIIAIKPPDETYQKMLAAYQACVDAGIGIPKEVGRFFNYENPEPSGVVIRLDYPALHACVREWTNNDSASGFEVDLALLPEGVKVLRFYNSW